MCICSRYTFASQNTEALLMNLRDLCVEKMDMQHCIFWHKESSWCTYSIKGRKPTVLCWVSCIPVWCLLLSLSNSSDKLLFLHIARISAQASWSTLLLIFHVQDFGFEVNFAVSHRRPQSIHHGMTFSAVPRQRPQGTQEWLMSHPWYQCRIIRAQRLQIPISARSFNYSHFHGRDRQSVQSLPSASLRLYLSAAMTQSRSSLL